MICRLCKKEVERKTVRKKLGDKIADRGCCSKECYDKLTPKQTDPARKPEIDGDNVICSGNGSKPAEPKEKPKKEKPPVVNKRTNITINQAEGSSEPWQIFDRLEDDLIIQEMKGTIGEFPLCYSFNMDGKPIYGINAKGCIELAKMVKGIMPDPKTPPKVISEENGYLRVGCFVMDVVNKVGWWGVASQPMFLVFRTGFKKFDDKAFIKAATKAQRNGFLKLIPERVQVAAIAEWLKNGKIQTLSFENVIGAKRPELDTQEPQPDTNSAKGDGTQKESEASSDVFKLD